MVEERQSIKTPSTLKLLMAEVEKHDKEGPSNQQNQGE